MKRAISLRKSEFPITISRGSVHLQIYRIINRGQNIFTAAYRGADGKRGRTNRSSLPVARSEAERIATLIANGEICAFTLSNTDRADELKETEPSATLTKHTRGPDITPA